LLKVMLIYKYCSDGCMNNTSTQACNNSIIKIIIIIIIIIIIKV